MSRSTAAKQPQKQQSAQKKRREYEIEFAEEGPIGITLQPQYDRMEAFPRVLVLKCVKGQQAEGFGLINESDEVIAVQDRPLNTFLEYTEFIQFLRTAKRPLKIRFSSLSESTPAQRVRDHLKGRLDALEQAINRDDIQLEEIREFSKTGLPDRHRALVWKILLGNLPLKRSEWGAHNAQLRELYETYKNDMFAKHARKDFILEGTTPPSRLDGQAWYEQTKEDEIKSSTAAQAALNQQRKQGSQEADYDVAEDILDDDIWKDVQRTHPGFHFFTQPTYVRMHRILYIYGRLNAGVSYVQGMNEILAPIAYVFGAYSFSDEENFESDTFFCFAALMSDVRDMFIRSLDGEKSGLHGQIKRLEEMVGRHDPEVSARLLQLDLHFQFFAVRWLTTLLTREFDLPDALRLWDSMLGAPKRFLFILCCCTALVIARRDMILTSDFPTCLKGLQAQCTLPVEDILQEAEKIYKKEIAGFRGYSRVVSLTAPSPVVFVQQRLGNVEAAASGLLKVAARVAKTVVDEAKAVVDDFKQPLPPTPSPQGQQTRRLPSELGEEMRPITSRPTAPSNDADSDDPVPFMNEMALSHT